jgi:hypothetical protein
MKNNLLFITLFCFAISLYSQNQIYSKNKTYESTNNWTFYMESYLGSIKMSIGKDKNKGVILLSLASMDKSDYLKGNLYLFLENGERIRCYDRNIKDYVDDKSISLYFLTPKEVELLYGNRILKIRFQLKEGRFEGYKSYTAKNGNGFTEVIKTEDEVFRLFNW